MHAAMWLASPTSYNSFQQNSSPHQDGHARLVPRALQLPDDLHAGSNSSRLKARGQLVGFAQRKTAPAQSGCACVLRRTREAASAPRHERAGALPRRLCWWWPAQARRSSLDLAMQERTALWLQRRGWLVARPQPRLAAGGPSTPQSSCAGSGQLVSRCCAGRMQAKPAHRHEVHPSCLSRRCQDSVLHSRLRVLPLPVGASSKAFSRFSTVLSTLDMKLSCTPYGWCGN